MTMAARILIVEDNAANLELVRYLLVSAGYEVLLAHNGAQGLELAQREQPDLIVSDLHMPVMDGYALIEALRRTPPCDTIPVVALTAFSMPGDRESIMQAGFSGYMSKPIEPELFVGQIAAFLAAGDAAPR
jgi:two-component system cell cycle response regulator DivK